MKALVLSMMVCFSTICVAQNTAKLTYEDGSVKSEYVKHNDLVAVTHYHQNGAVKEKGFFKNETPDGKWVLYAEDGTKISELHYENGLRHGEFRSWDRFTNTYLEMHYANGEVINADKYEKKVDLAAKK